MPINRLAIAALVGALSLHAAPPVELIKAHDLPHVAKLWQHGADTPFGISTSASPPKPIIIGANELPAPYAKGDSLFWVPYTGQPLAKGDLFLFVYHGALTVRPVGSVSNMSVKTALGTEVKLSDVRGVVRRVIRVVPD